MVWVVTGTVFAQVVQMQPVRYRPMQQLIHHTMCGSCSPGNANARVRFCSTLWQNPAFVGASGVLHQS
jgi:hypothetical protein